MSAHVVAVSRDGKHRFSKPAVDAVRLLAGLGIEGDAHCGERVKHRSRARFNPSLPNLRQVHLIHAELFGELRNAGFSIAHGDMGENITTQGIDLLSLPQGALLHLGATAVVEVTGLRNPCVQMDRFSPGLMQANLAHDAEGNLIRKSGVMSIVLAGGEVRAGDRIETELPVGERRPLKPV